MVFSCTIFRNIPQLSSPIQTTDAMRRSAEKKVIVILIYIVCSTFRHGLIHKQCLCCGLCKRTLNSTSFYDGREDVYCVACYSDNFGVRGRRSAAVETTRLVAGEGDESRCPRCAGKVFEAERMRTTAGSFHPGCLRCGKCNANIDQSSMFCSEGDIFCQLCYKEEYGVHSRRSRPRSRCCCTSEKRDVEHCASFEFF